MNELKSKVKIKIGSEKNFGIVFSIFFIVLGFLSFLNKGIVNPYFFFISFIFLFLSFFYSSIFKYPNKIWFKIGIILGLFVSPLIMFLIYYIIFLPIGFIMRLINKDFLQINIDKKIPSYWTDKEKKTSTMKNQF